MPAPLDDRPTGRSFAPLLAGLAGAFERAAAAGHVLYGLRRARAWRRPIWAPRPGFACRHASRRARSSWSLAAPTAARSAWAGVGTADFADVSLEALEGRAGRAPGLGGDGASSLPPAATRSSCPPTRSPTS